MASTTYDSYGFWLGILNSFGSAAQTDMLLDVAIGPNQEHIIIPNLLCGWRGAGNNQGGPQVLFFPIYVPAGSLISARAQGLISSDTVSIMIMLQGGTSALPGPLYSGCDAYGVETASSQGTSHTPGNSGAESTAANVGSTLAKSYRAVLLQVQGTLTNTAANNIAYHWELVIGGGVVCEWYALTTNTESHTGPMPSVPFHTSLPAGTQLQIQAEASGTAQAQDVAFYCFY